MRISVSVLQNCAAFLSFTPSDPKLSGSKKSSASVPLLARSEKSKQKQRKIQRKFKSKTHIDDDDDGSAGATAATLMTMALLV